MKTAGTFSQNHLNLGFKTHLNGTLISNIVIDTSQLATDTTHRPKRPFKESFGGFQMWFIKVAFLAAGPLWLVRLTDQSLVQSIRLGPDRR
jgi:hypothetical protein